MGLGSITYRPIATATAFKSGVKKCLCSPRPFHNQNAGYQADADGEAKAQESLEL